MGEEATPFRGELGERVRHARARRGWTREELAARAGISWSGITQIESGRRRNVRPDTLAALTRALEVTADYLVHGGAAVPRMLRHRALFYEGDEDFVTQVGALVAEAVERGEAARVATTDARVRGVRALLGDRADGVEFLAADDLYVGDATLAAHREFVAAAVRGGASWAHIVGDPMWSGPRAQGARWYRFEAMMTLALSELPLNLVCACAADAPAAVVRGMCETHPETVSGGAVEPSREYVEPAAQLL